MKSGAELLLEGAPTPGPRAWMGILAAGAMLLGLWMFGRKKARPARKPGRLEHGRCAARGCFKRIAAVDVLCGGHVHEVPVILRNQIARAEGAAWVRLVARAVDFVDELATRRRALADLEPGCNAPFGSAWDDAEARRLLSDLGVDP